MGRLKTLEQSCLSAVDVTQERLLTLLKENAETEFGKKHEFSEICSVYDYKRKVPFSVFDDYAASVDRMMRGEKHVLTAYPISFYAHTSGTLGKAKNIPFSEKAEGLVRDHASVSGEAYAEYLSGMPQRIPSAPKTLYLATAREDHAPDGTMITNFSGRFMIENKAALQRIAVKPELIFCDEPMDLPYLFAFFALREKELTCISAPFMAAVSDFFCYIEKHWKELCRDMEEGKLRPDERTSPVLIDRLSADLSPDPERAGALREIFSKGFDSPVAAAIWPCLQYVQAIGAAGFSSYTSIVRRFIGDLPIHMSVYAASEGLFGISVKMNIPEYVLIPDAGYFEFIPEEDAELPEAILRERTLEMDQLQPGRKYEMVVTNLSGFYRYRIGDVVTVNGYLGQSPVICFSYRRHQILNIAGEKTHEDMIQHAVDCLKKSEGIHAVEWSACADYRTSPARYLLFLETDLDREPDTKQEMQSLLDERLSEVSEYYAQYRQDGKLGPLELILLQPQTFALYRDIQVWNGASPNQLKPVHVISTPNAEAFFRGLKI